MAGSHLPGENRRCGGGFTLIEVLIAVVVLSVGIVMILQGLHGVLGVWDGAVERLRSVMLVRESLETTRLEAVQSGNAPSDSSGQFDAPFTRYRWRTEVEQAELPVRAGTVAARDVGDGLYSIRSTVWREGSSRDFAASTLVFVPPSEGEVRP